MSACTMAFLVLVAGLWRAISPYPLRCRPLTVADRSFAGYALRLRQPRLA